MAIGIQFSIILFAFYPSLGFITDDITSVTVHTSVGDIVGKIETFSWDKDQFIVKEFLGIPFAEAPVGKLRLKKPVPKSKFTSPFKAFKFGPACLQQPDSIAKSIELSEDCLFLNIYVPLSVNKSTVSTASRFNSSDTMFPVMVFIHGGGFSGGVSTYFSSDVLASFGQVIVVTINYRLAHMGFLRTNEIFENFGLWDQHLAFQWVKQNIAAFGGDNNLITIFGESAGSESVVYQVLYPGNKGLFRRAIAESIGINSGRAFITNETAAKLVENFAQVIGCNLPTTDIIECIRNKSTDDIKNATQSPNLIYDDKTHPVEDNDFVPKHPNAMISSPSASSLEMFHSIDFIMGSTSIDGALYLGDWAKRLNITDLEKFTIPRHVFESEFIPDELAYHFTDVKSIPDVAKELTVFVYTNWTAPDNDLQRNFMLVDYFSDSRMFMGMVSSVQLHAKSDKGRTYMYEFSIKPTTHLIPVPKWLDGPGKAIHADDLYFVFGYDEKMLDWFRAAGLSINYTDSDIASAKTVMTMWTNFAKSGYVFFKRVLIDLYHMTSRLGVK